MKKNKKIVRIRVASFERVLQETSETMKRVIRRQPVKAEPRTLSFPDLATLRSILTDERIRLLQLVQTKKPESILELARLADRQYANVFNDLQTLQSLGLVQLNSKNRKTMPVSSFAELEIKIPLSVSAK
jgi:predicted transcriptional regulator